MSAVSRETLSQLRADFGLSKGATDRIERLLGALAAEPDPHTSVSDPAQALDVHVRDSLVALEITALRSAGSVADIGAGAGFPGLALAVALPGARFDLIDSASRKCAVIERLAHAAGIANARAVHARAEEWAAPGPAGAYDVVTARAVAPLAVLVEYAAPLLAIGGVLVAWKGAPGAEEVRAGAAASSELGLEPLEPLPVTPYRGTRHLNLYLYSKVSETPARYPRRAGMAAKRPLGARSRPTPPLT